MGLRDNFKQAAKELMDGPDTSRSQDPAPAPDSTLVPESVPEFAAEETGAPGFQDTGLDLDGPGASGAVMAPRPLPRPAASPRPPPLSRRALLSGAP